MRPKKRYILAHYDGDGNALDAIKARYTEKFGVAELEKTSLKIISDKDGFLTVQCNLDCCKHLMEALTSMNSKFVTLNMAGTLKSLRSRQEEIKKRFMSGNRY